MTVGATFGSLKEKRIFSSATVSKRGTPRTRAVVRGLALRKWARFRPTVPKASYSPGGSPRGTASPRDRRSVRLAGSWFGPSLDLMAGAAEILATSCPSFDHAVTFGCGDSLFMSPDDGLGLCTGTSMSAAFVTGLVGMIRSGNPHLSNDGSRFTTRTR